MDCEDEHLPHENDVHAERKSEDGICSAQHLQEPQNTVPDDTVVANLFFQCLQKEENLTLFS